MPEEQQKTEVTEVQPGTFSIAALGDYELLPEAEGLQAHISKVGTAYDWNFEKTEKVNKLVLYFEIDEPTGKGQTYQKWIGNPLAQGPNSTFGPILKAIYGDGERPTDASELVGKAVRVELETVLKDGAKRQRIVAVKKPAASQKDVVVAPKATQDEAPLEDFDLDKALDDAGV